MINYNENTINKWNFDDSEIVKVYYNGNVCYQEITSGSTPPTPQTVIKSPEYLERNASNNGYVPLGVYFTDTTKIQVDFQLTNTDGYSVIGDYCTNDRDDWRFMLGAYMTTQQKVMYDFGASRLQVNLSSNFLRYNWEVGNYYIKDLSTGNNVVSGASHTNFTRPNQMYLFHLEGGSSQQNTDYGHVYSIKIYQNDVLVKDFIPWTDMNGNYGLYDKVTNTVTQSVGQMTGSSVINDVVIEPNYANEYLTLVAETDNVSVSYSTATAGNKLQYSLNSGSTWNVSGTNGVPNGWTIGTASS